MINIQTTYNRIILLNNQLLSQTLMNLIQISQENLGDVVDCDKVLEASQQYREREDYLE